ncbi:hypothetical protein Vretifemale_6917 [Volvox reticuliferus]|uniref:Uncharacterized protein n=1 Tax=Volvox reticuliferus TaxID=1737510 RepID=A0A8J4C803_9CHLO|nr:hypothetical protein Vretifemale_6917 [Volvox reticuliferus]
MWASASRTTAIWGGVAHGPTWREVAAKLVRANVTLARGAFIRDCSYSSREDYKARLGAAVGLSAADVLVLCVKQQDVAPAQVLNRKRLMAIVVSGGAGEREGAIEDAEDDGRRGENLRQAQIRGQNLRQRAR